MVPHAPRRSPAPRTGSSRWPPRCSSQGGDRASARFLLAADSAVRRAVAAARGDAQPAAARRARRDRSAAAPSCSAIRRRRASRYSWQWLDPPRRAARHPARSDRHALRDRSRHRRRSRVSKRSELFTDAGEARGPEMTPDTIAHDRRSLPWPVRSAASSTSCIHRLPRGDSVVTPAVALPRHAATSCAGPTTCRSSATLLLRGRCRKCRRPDQHPLSRSSRSLTMADVPPALCGCSAGRR